VGGYNRHTVSIKKRDICHTIRHIETLIVLLVAL